MGMDQQTWGNEIFEFTIQVWRLLQMWNHEGQQIPVGYFGHAFDMGLS
jgi:hypothetical protein